MPTDERLEVLITARDQTQGVFSKLSGSVSGFGSVLSGIIGAQLLPRLTSGIASVGQQALTEVANFERLSLSMESLIARELRAGDSTLSMGDALAQAAPRAQDLLTWVQQLAIKSPFSQEGVATAFRTALAYGFTSEQAQTLTGNLINFVSATGQTEGAMNQVALALGQIQAKGKLAGQEILQLVNAGVPVNDILADMGFTLDDVSKGLVSADDFLAAFNATMESDFASAAERGADSLGGLLNSLGDLKAIGLRELFTGIIEPLRGPLADIVARLNTPAFMAQLRALGETVGGLLQQFLDFVTNVRLEDIFGAETIAAVAGLAAGIQTLAETIGAFAVNVLMPFVQEHWAELRGALVGVGAILAAGVILNGILAIAGVITALLSPIGLLIAGAALLGAAWAGNWGGMRDILTAFWTETAQPALSQLWAWLQVKVPAAIDTLKKFWVEVLQPALMNFWAWVQTNVFPLLQTLWNWLQVAVPAALQTLSNYWTTVLKPGIEQVWSFLQTDVIPLLSALGTLLSVTLSLALEALAGVWQTVLQPALASLWEWVNDKIMPVLETFGAFLNDTLYNAFIGIRNAIQWVIDKIQALILKLKGLTLPSWLTPGSPTPFETGLWGIGEALRDVARLRLPAFALAVDALGPGLPAPLTAPAPRFSGRADTAGPARREVTIYGLTINTSAPTRSVLDELEAML